MEGGRCQIPSVKGKEWRRNSSSSFSPGFWSLSGAHIGHSQALVNKRGQEVQCPQVSFLRPEQGGGWTRVGQEPVEISQKSGAKSTKSLPSSSFHSGGSQTVDTPPTPPTPENEKRAYDPITLSAVEKNRAGAELEVGGAVLNRGTGGL